MKIEIEIEKVTSIKGNETVTMKIENQLVNTANDDALPRASDEKSSAVSNHGIGP